MCNAYNELIGITYEFSGSLEHSLYQGFTVFLFESLKLSLCMALNAAKKNEMETLGFGDGRNAFHHYCCA